MKTYVSIFLFLCLANSPQKTSAQQFTIQWEEESDKNQLMSSETGVTTKTGNIISFKTKQSKGRKLWSWYTDIAELMLFDKNMNELKKVPFTLEESNVSEVEMVKRGNHVYMLYSSFDEGTYTNAAHALKIDEETLTATEKILLGRTSPKKGVRLNSQKAPTQTARYIYSADSSLLLAYIDEQGADKANKKFSLAVFDENFKKKWSHSVEFDLINAETIFLDLMLNNQGKAFITFREKDQTSKELRFNTVLHIFDKDAPKGKKIQLNKEHLIDNARISFDSEKSIIVAGLYKTKQHGNIKGVVYQKIDIEAMKHTSAIAVPFPEDFLALVDNDGFAEKKGADAGLSKKFYLGGIFTRPNGSVDILAEFISEKYNGDGRSGRWEYVYGDIVSVNFSANGVVKFTRIPKKQENVSIRQYLSYMPFLYQDKLIVMYNDDRSNIDRDINAKPDKILYYKKAVLTAAIIDTQGNLTRQAIYDNKESDYITNPTYSYRLSSDQIQIQGVRYRIGSDKRKMGILTIK